MQSCTITQKSKASPVTATSVQTRSRSDELIGASLAGFRFDPPEIDKELNEKIATIKQMHDQEGKTFRAIAGELGISKSQAQRLHGLCRNRLP